MVVEGVVLLGVKNLKQGTGGVAAEVGAQFVNLVQQEQRIACIHLREVLQHLARQSTDIGTTMAANFCLVPHTAQGHTHIFTPCGLGNGLTQRGFTHARRTDQTQNRRFDLVNTLLNRQILQDAVFDFFKTVVVFVENRLGVHQVVFDLGSFAPRQTNQDINVIAHHGGLGRHG